MATSPASRPNPLAIFNALNGYQHSMALKAAIDLELFTHIADGATTSAELAKKASASERGTRILCDYLTISGFLTKENGSYGLSPDAAIFLNKKSPAYLGGTSTFLLHESHLANYRDLAAAVRKGGTTQGQGNMDRENPVWVEFARSMAPLAAISAPIVAAKVTEPGKKVKVLDIAAGHGLYGIAVAKHNPAAEVVALDWKNVLEVALENARAAGVADRYQTIAGSAFDTDLGSGYDVVLIPNFLHHFDPPTNTAFLKKIRAAMNPGGLVATPEFVPEDDRITPPTSGSFSLMMLGSTEGGDAYTFKEYDQMFRDAGFSESKQVDFTPSPQQLIVTNY